MLFVKEKEYTVWTEKKSSNYLSNKTDAENNKNKILANFAAVVHWNEL